MARIKKRGLDYFPINTDFIHDRAVRRLMKREGDAALAVLLEVLTYVYAGEGYYVRADSLFYEDLSAGLYEKSAADVERIIRLAVEYGLFDAGLFEKCGILTSAEIQRQYLFSTRRRLVSALETDYCLVKDEESAEKQAVAKGERDTDAKLINDDVTLINENVTLTAENVTPGTHSIAQNSIAQHSVAQNRKEYPLLNPPLETAGEEVKTEEGKEGFFSDSTFGMDASGGSGKRNKWTQETIDALLPPADGTVRNFDGLLYNLHSYKIPPAEQYAIIRKSNFGAIGGRIWKGIATLRASGGKIKLPGRYLLSVVNRTEEVAVG